MFSQDLQATAKPKISLGSNPTFPLSKRATARCGGRPTKVRPAWRHVWAKLLLPAATLMPLLVWVSLTRKSRVPELPTNFSRDCAPVGAASPESTAATPGSPQMFSTSSDLFLQTSLGLPRSLQLSRSCPFFPWGIGLTKFASAENGAPLWKTAPQRNASSGISMPVSKRIGQAETTHEATLSKFWCASPGGTLPHPLDAGNPLRLFLHLSF